MRNFRRSLEWMIASVIVQIQKHSASLETPNLQITYILDLHDTSYFWSSFMKGLRLHARGPDADQFLLFFGFVFVVFLPELQLATSVRHDPSEYQAGS